MKHPQFSVGDKVLHTSQGEVGEITRAFFDGEEHRYYVWHSGFAWSAPESALSSEISRFSPLKNRKVTETNFPKMPGDEFPPAAWGVGA